MATAATLAALHTVALPKLSEPVAKGAAQKVLSPRETVRTWLSDLEEKLAAGNFLGVAGLIHQDGWWRDHLALSWDLSTLHGLDRISSFITKHLPQAELHNLKLQETGKFAPHTEHPIADLQWVQSMFSFDTAVGSGKGMLRLVQSPDGSWKAHMVYTALQELSCARELAGPRRPHGGNNSVQEGPVQGNWHDKRQRQIEFRDEEPAVLIVGAGQAGLNLGARLQALGLSCLLVDKNERVGDNWRHRYRTLVTHDPVQYTHMAYMPFPSNWPLFTPKDKLADWFEIYAGAMELNIWLQCTIAAASYCDDTRTWTVDVQRGGNTPSTRTLKPRHVVFCTGHAGEPKVPTFPGQETFNGTVYHASQHKDAATSSGSSVAGKHVVVVGTGNSGHDIAQNYHENGAASVTMLQRRGTYVISARTGLFMLHEGLYDEHGPPIEDADVFGQSLPIPVQFALNVSLTERIRAAEKPTLDGLERAGFKLDYGSDGSGIYRKYVTRGGGYYIDVGASQLIVDGKIKVVQSPEGIQKFTSDGLVVADGRQLDADIVVLATGFDNMRTTLRKALGDKIADRCSDVWDLDEQGEVNAMWRPSGHPRLWFMGGSLALCRLYSKMLALQIRAAEEGLTGT